MLPQEVKCATMQIEQFAKVGALAVIESFAELLS